MSEGTSNVNNALDSTWRDRRVLVTGATGFAGGWLVRALLDAGAYVVAYVRDWDPQSALLRTGLVQRVHVVNGQLEEYPILERGISEHEVDTVFHLGAQAIVGTALRSPLATFEANVRGTYHVLEACRVHADLVQAVVVASSDKAYGTSSALPYTEDMPLRGVGPYDASKSCTDLIAFSYAQTYGLPLAVTRCGNLFGGGDRNWSRLIPGTLRSLLRGERPIIRSDGHFLRDYLYIEDAVAGMLAVASALARPDVRGQAFNLAPEQPRSVLEVVDTLRQLLRREELVPIIQNQAEHEIRDQYLSAAKAHQLLGWQPTHAFEVALRLTIAWYADDLGVAE
jgi:CDP-glucose 4,6-dehydratase